MNTETDFYTYKEDTRIALKVITLQNGQKVNLYDNFIEFLDKMIQMETKKGYKAYQTVYVDLDDNGGYESTFDGIPIDNTKVHMEDGLGRTKVQVVAPLQSMEQEDYLTHRGIIYATLKGFLEATVDKKKTIPAPLFMAIQSDLRILSFLHQEKGELLSNLKSDKGFKASELTSRHSLITESNKLDNNFFKPIVNGFVTTIMFYGDVFNKIHEGNIKKGIAIKFEKDGGTK